MVVTYWQKCTDCLKVEIPSQQFNTWIRPLHAEMDSDTLRLFAPNRFIQDWVKGKFLGRISEIVKELAGDDLQVMVEVASLDRSATADPKITIDSRGLDRTSPVVKPLTPSLTRSHHIQ